MFDKVSEVEQKMLELEKRGTRKSYGGFNNKRRHSNEMRREKRVGIERKGRF